MEERLKFWDNRANLGYKAGSNDEILKTIEVNEIKKYINNNVKVLEIGCGNGITAIELAKSFNIDILAVDYSPKMIANAKLLLSKESSVNLKNRIKFEVLDVRDFSKITEKYDIVISERVLINIDSHEEQLKIINRIYNILSSKGKFIMCESSKQGLEMINIEREKFELPRIEMPWHNNYIDDERLQNDLKKINLKLSKINHFSSTYYFLSRIIYAHYANENKLTLDYNSIINQMSYKLPVYGKFSQTKIWEWEK
tara:strand:- start:5488 stop:6252 length:765 start_codon:yes stop_codon:yes gene_type:complete